MPDIAFDLTKKNRRVGAIMLLIAAGMVGMAYLSVPLYKLFCQVTGFGGTTQVSTLSPGTSPEILPGAIQRQVAFNRHISPGLDWQVIAPEASRLMPGEEITVIYLATNTTDKTVVGTSSFNVTPHKIGPYFMKIECFCFTEQTLQPGETAEMPVTFYLDPEIDDDINTKATPEITLSYTFFPVKMDSTKTGKT
jgi:cytochrome c oxidase assembly protein subunit 11